MIWFLDDAHAAMVSALAGASASFEAEQAVRGLDSLDEIALHAMVAPGLAGAGFGVHREVRYPTARGKRKRSEGRRCDLVVTPEGLPLDEDALQPTLLRPPRVVSLSDALWVEVKTAAQYVQERPNPSYGSALQGPIWRDLEKLAADPVIEHAAQLVVLFTVDEETAAHDLRVTLDRAWSRGLRIDARHVAGFAIGDRFGNGRCTVALVRVLR